LQEELHHKIPPPIFKSSAEQNVSTFITVLDTYESYAGYLEVFYPLLLLELWTEISNDYHENSPKDPRKEYDFL